MHPALSLLFFTTLIGAGQGLAVAIALGVLFGVPLAPSFVASSLVVAELLLVGGLAASFLHLGHKLRAWRSVLMWRTSWMSREVIALPAFIALVAVWWVALRSGVPAPWSTLLPLAVVVGAGALWLCTAMIYACLRFIEEWAHPLTIVNFTLTGLSSGFVVACALGTIAGETRLVHVAGPVALVVTLAAWATRWMAIRRNATLRHKSTLQSAIGVASPNLVQKSMGMSAGSFNTREFFHGATRERVIAIRFALQVFGFAVPVLLVLVGLFGDVAWAWIAAMVVQAPGLIADRWTFFAQAKHPQNLYYQVVS